MPIYTCTTTESTLPGGTGREGEVAFVFDEQLS
jgi:hypothetical protein